MTVSQLLAQAKAAGLDRLDAHLLLSFVLGRPRTWLLANDDVVLSVEDAARIGGLIERRAAGEPMAYLLGEKEFHGLMLAVDASVLVPRPDTETLVAWALDLLAGDLLAGDAPGRSVIDLGTGSGAIALAVKQARPDVAMTAVDASEAALKVANANAQRLGLDVEFVSSDWWSALIGRRFDLVLSNPPYIAEGDAHLAALTHEPIAALTAGADGLDDIRALVATSLDHMNAHGWLVLEHGADQAEAVRALMNAQGFGHVESRRDLAGHERCTAGRSGPRERGDLPPTSDEKGLFAV
ncbi:MAG: hemK [Rhizobacter sp.]|nr:hemK [Rhizobacter sp.]